MSCHESQAEIIERLTRRHSSDGYTSYPALCDALEAELRLALAELDQCRSRCALLLAENQRAASWPLGFPAHAQPAQRDSR
ncbi:MAG: hypothetical protein KF863_21595 [Rubrivivax sp.]|nr:hypothetical protein [Rubrivivax sp.]